MRITVIGATGYTGAHLVTEALARGHAVTAISRSITTRTADLAAGRTATSTGTRSVGAVTHLAGDVLQDAFLPRAVSGADVVLSALSPRGALAGRTRGVLASLAGVSSQAGARLGVVGGAGSLRMSETGPFVVDTEAVPEPFEAEAREMAGVLDDLRRNEDGVRWFYVSPAAGFGPWAPGVRTGTYRTGGDVLLVDEQGQSAISGEDLAHAVLEEIETPTHHQQRFSVAY